MSQAVRCNLIVLRSRDLERAATFYTALGLKLSRHAHGNGPIHLAHESGGQVFEIYPLAQDGMETTAARIGFAVPSVDEAFTALLAAGGRPVSSPKDSPWGRRAIISDPDGHRIELTSSADSDN